MGRRLTVLPLSILLLVLAGAGSLPGAAETTAAAAALSPEARDRLAAAVTAYAAGDWKAAARGFSEAAPAAAPIQEYALYLQADSLARLGDAAAARAVAEQAMERAGEGPLFQVALVLAAREASRSGDEPATVRLNRRFLERFPEHAGKPAAQLALANSLEATGASAEALRVYRQIWLTAPASLQAERAGERQRALVAGGLPAVEPTPRERIDRAERLLSGGQPVVARGEAEALLAENPPVDLALRALRVVFESWRRTGKSDEALRVADRAIALAPADRRSPWLMERARLVQPRVPEALAALDRLLREHPQSPDVPVALLMRAQLLDRSPVPADAEAAYLKLAADHPAAEEAGTALWRLGWLSWFRGAMDEAAQRWTRLIALPGGERLRDGAQYWAGRALAERGDAAGASKHWRDLIAGASRSYYGVLAAARLPRAAAPARAAAAPPLALPAEPLAPVRDDPHMHRAAALRSVGLPEWADVELVDLARRSAGDVPRLYAVSAAFAAEARHHLALRILRRDFYLAARSGHELLPRRFWEMLYPIGWRAEMTSAANRAGLDPFFVAAVVREESSYDPRARSRVGARGLMQLMPETARPLARQQGVTFREGEVLDDPGVNLDLGTTFIAQLVRDFGDPRLAVAAYNAGPRRAREWWTARKSDDLEVWVEQIPFNETRAFVKRVTVSWEEYRRLYGAKP